LNLRHDPTAKTLILLVPVLAVIFGFVSSYALLAGIFISLTLGNPWLDRTKLIAPKILSYSIVALGAGMNLMDVLKAGYSGLTYTFITITLTLAAGYGLAKVLKSNLETSALVTVGTAICGGSAIAAAWPAVGAKSNQVSMALGIVFLLNSAALLVFPTLGHWFGFSQTQFGLWAALAIHDTSSVVGATMQYGLEALRVGTTIKLARAVWIIPLTVFLSWAFRNIKKNSHSDQKVKRPWFILGFLLSTCFFSLMTAKYPNFAVVRDTVEWIGKRGLVMTLFFIGLNMNLKSIQEMGFRPAILGVVLWIFVLGLSALAISKGWIALDLASFQRSVAAR